MQIPPKAPRIPHFRNIHNETVEDDWFYLRDQTHPETLPYLEAENRYTDAMTRESKALETELYDEMLGRIQETDVSVPWPMGSYEYYSRSEAGKQYPILCRRKVSTVVEETMLDCNAIAEGHPYFAMAFDHVSPDGRILAYAINTDGSEVYTLRFRDLTTGEHLTDEITGVYYSAAWAADSGIFFYTTLDAIKRPSRLWRHHLHQQEPDVMVFEEPDERFNVGINRSRSGRFLFLSVDSHTTTEFCFLEAADPCGEFRLLQARRQGVEYFVEHQGDTFYMRTNEAGKNFRLLRAPVHDFSLAGWEEVIPHRQNVALEQVEGFENHLVIVERAEGLRQLRVQDTRSGAEHFVNFDEPDYTFSVGSNEEYATAQIRFVYTSFVTPQSVYDYNMDTQNRELKKRHPVLGGYDPEQYQTERIFATAEDGVRVPISLLYRRGLQRDGRNPLYLYGYGSYGIVTDPGFSSERLSLIDRGFVYALSHIRGSGDMGRLWYEDGKLQKKQNTFRDFVACAEHLIAEGYAGAGSIAIAGGSAGGLLMGAVTNLRPDLFQTVVAHVPFVDVVNTMLDPTLPLTVTEYEEWGNPNEPEVYRYIRAYAPYENIECKSYPHILVTAGLNDPRVPYWEPAKWVAKLRDSKTDGNTILLKTNMGAGHGGPSGRYEKLKEKAFEYAFVIGNSQRGV